MRFLRVFMTPPDDSSQSGTGILTYGHETKGMAATDVIYDDSDFEQVANIDPAAFHRNVDSAIFDADRAGA